MCGGSESRGTICACLFTARTTNAQLMVKRSRASCHGDSSLILHKKQLSEKPEVFRWREERSQFTLSGVYLWNGGNISLFWPHPLNNLQPRLPDKFGQSSFSNTKFPTQKTRHYRQIHGYSKRWVMRGKASKLWKQSACFDFCIWYSCCVKRIGSSRREWTSSSFHTFQWKCVLKTSMFRLGFF